MNENADAENDQETENERKVIEVKRLETEDEKDTSWGRDQREKSYYYDDSYGYEVYDPDQETDDES